MRRALGVVAALMMVSAWSNLGHAQTVNNPGGFSDPFFLYYGWYLPQQNALANQPRVQDTINAAAGQNAAAALTNRSALYDPNGGYGRFNPNPSGDPFDPAARAGGGANPRLQMRAGVPTSNVNGNGPAMYYNRAAQFYPSMRPGRGANRNIPPAPRGVRGGGVGVPGPR